MKEEEIDKINNKSSKFYKIKNPLCRDIKIIQSNYES